MGDLGSYQSFTTNFTGIFYVELGFSVKILILFGPILL